MSKKSLKKRIKELENHSREDLRALDELRAAYGNTSRDINVLQNEVRRLEAVIRKHTAPKYAVTALFDKESEAVNYLNKTHGIIEDIDSEGVKEMQHGFIQENKGKGQMFKIEGSLLFEGGRDLTEKEIATAFSGWASTIGASFCGGTEEIK